MDPLTSASAAAEASKEAEAAEQQQQQQQIDNSNNSNGAAAAAEAEAPARVEAEAGGTMNEVRRVNKFVFIVSIPLRYFFPVVFFFVRLWEFVLVLFIYILGNSVAVRHNR